jgi:uncharacterized protein YjbI with pentapeptide repeats
MKLNDNRIKTLIKLFLIYLVVLVIFTVGYNELPIFIHYSILEQDSFYSGFITNMYNSALDFLVFSIVLFIYLGRHERNDKVQLYQDNIDDCRFWYSDEAAFKNAGNIRRLQLLDVKTFDLSKSSLLNTKLKEAEFIDTKFMGACLDGANFEKSIFRNSDFKGVSAKNSFFNSAKFFDCNLKYIDLYESQLKSCEFKNCDFTKAKLEKVIFRASVFDNCEFGGADLSGCIFERADLRLAKGLSTNQLLMCENIKYARLDQVLVSEINAINPKLLNK